MLCDVCCYLLYVVYCLVCDVCCVLTVACCMLCVPCRCVLSVCVAFCMLVVGCCWSIAVCHRAGCAWFVFGGVMLVALCRALSVVGCLLCVGWCVKCVSLLYNAVRCCVLCAGCWLMFVAVCQYLVFRECYMMLFVVCCSVVVV